MNKFSLIMISLITFALSACNGDENEMLHNDKGEISLTQVESDIVSNSHYDFGLQVYQLLSEKNENFVFSPLGLSMSTSMVANAANSETRNEILKVLGYDNNDLSGLNELNKKLISDITQLDKTSTISIANGIWYSNTLGVKTKVEFIDLLKGYYSSEIKGFDNLSSKDALNSINNWCNTHTNGIIPSMISSPIDESSLMLFLNAFYFRGLWSEKFDKALTKNRTFYSYTGESNKVPMMMNTKMKAYGYGTDKYTAVSLSYGNKAFSMIIILPDKGYSLAECLTSEELRNIQKLATRTYKINETLRVEEKSLNILLPKFNLESNIDFTDILKSLGIKKAFDKNTADLSNFFEIGKYFINSVKQISKISVDEEGTTAVSVTKWDGNASADFIELTDFIVDRPFAFIISESSTGTPLFMGKISKL